jgi:hypothetical protein
MGLKGGKAEPEKKVAHGDHIAKTHQTLLSKGILTKSMINLYLMCPEKFRMAYIDKVELKPSWSLSLGKSMHDLMEEWGNRKLAGTGWGRGEVRQYLSDKWDHYMGEVPESTWQATKDEKMKQFMAIWEDWKKFQRTLKLGKLVGSEVAFGYDGSITLGGVSIAGHADTVWERGVTDFKVVNMRSRYRKEKATDIERVMYSVLAGVNNVYLLPCIHDYKRPPKTGRIEKVGGTIKAETKERVGNIIAVVKRGIDEGFFPPTAEVVNSMGNEGSFPCSEKWCDHYNKCVFTKTNS